MATVIDAIRRRLQRLGWSVRDMKVVTLAGSRLWLISARRRGQTFSAQGETQREALGCAWRLAQRLHPAIRKASMILPFPGRRAICSRAG
jgi:hypothetical protein